MFSENPKVPTIASPLELREGTAVDFNCSTPYACPQESISLEWQGQDPTRSVTSSLQKLEPTGIRHLESLTLALSWKDHGQTLRCQLSVVEFKTQGEIHLQVQREYAGCHILVTEHTSVAPLWKPVPLQPVAKQP